VAFFYPKHKQKEQAMPIPNINNVVLTGQLMRDPDLRVLPSGASACNLRIAVNASHKPARPGSYE
jgi:Single-strand binding protein family